MAIWDKPLDDVSEQDLQALITNQVAEQRTLDYKRDLPTNSDQDKVELRADVSSFANAAGGYLIFGMDARKGVPSELTGVEVDNADAEILRLEDTVQGGVRPRIPGLATRVLVLLSGRQVVVMRIPRSWAAPHMVMNTKDWSRFYSRKSNGKYPLDIGEIRAAFLRSETFAAQVRSFRAERLAKVVAGETPLLLPETAKLVLHIVPFGAFDPGAQLDLAPPHVTSPTLWSAHPIGTLAATQRYNFDGLMRFGDDSYVQVFRNGCIEAVDATILRPFEGRFQIPGSLFEHSLVRALRIYLALERQLGIEPPLLVMLSLVGVRGYAMAVRDTLFTVGPPSKIDRDTLVVPEELVENYERLPEDILKRTFDTIWNATGWSRSMNYDEEGHWLGTLT